MAPARHASLLLLSVVSRESTPSSVPIRFELTVTGNGLEAQASAARLSAAGASWGDELDELHECPLIPC
eukprot:371033-Hanusia_phi.AAC.1